MVNILAGIILASSVSGAVIDKSQVDGTFNGWTGDTIVLLMDGTVWKQADYSYDYEYEFMPNVIVYQGDNGPVMHIDGVNDDMPVTQLR